MKKRTKIMICVTIALVAIGITLYPLISNFISDANRSLVETRYEKAVSQMDDTEIIHAHMDAQNYNAMLLNVTSKPYTKESLQQASESYDQLLNIRGDGIMGYLEIPILNVDLPIYHGTSEETLDRGLGHLLGSSLPVGGTGTHAVITGHSGLAGQRIFSDLDKLKTGDIFYLKVLDETLAYYITEISTVLPEDTSKLTIAPDQDCVTLVTCTPYGVNTHRLLVRGVRIAYEQAASLAEEAIVEQAPQSTWKQQYLRGIAYGLAGIAITAITVVSVMRIAKGRTKKNTRQSIPRSRSESYSPYRDQTYGRSQQSRDRNAIKPYMYQKPVQPKPKARLIPERKRGKHEA